MRVSIKMRIKKWKVRMEMGLVWLIKGPAVVF